MNKRSGLSSIAVAIAVVAVIIIAGIAYYAGTRHANPSATTSLPAPQTSVTSTQGAYDTTGSTPAPAQNKVYENDLLKITIPAGWSYKDLPNGSINITKGDYILYINPNAGHASPFSGGRFAEVAEGAPSADAVDERYPDPCGSSDYQPAMQGFSRIDMYMTSADHSVGCTPPRQGNVWYFAYVSRDGGYFNDYSNWLNPDDNFPYQFVITMASRITDPSSLPQKGSIELTNALDEMTSILKTLQLKHDGSPVVMSTQYRNDQYGFYFSLPKGWAGYRVMYSRWRGSVDGGYPPTEVGPAISLEDIRNNPSPHESWQDIPIMVFTIDQWDKNLVVSAAPVGPAELGRNNKYVFALPPRSIGFVATLGVQEVSEWVQSHSLHTFNVQ